MSRGSEAKEGKVATLWYGKGKVARRKCDG